MPIHKSNDLFFAICKLLPCMCIMSIPVSWRTMLKRDGASKLPLIFSFPLAPTHRNSVHKANKAKLHETSGIERAGILCALTARADSCVLHPQPLQSVQHGNDIVRLVHCFTEGKSH